MMDMTTNQLQYAVVKVISSEKFNKIQFVGTRSLDESIKIWSDLSQLIDNSHKNLLIEDEMTGKMSANETSCVIESISDYKTYKSKKIAIVLKEESSYNSRLFDIIARNCGVCIKHFKLEEEAIGWLTVVD
jgi:hypothetical protein